MCPLNLTNYFFTQGYSGGGGGVNGCFSGTDYGGGNGGSDGSDGEDGNNPFCDYHGDGGTGSGVDVTAIALKYFTLRSASLMSHFIAKKTNSYTLLGALCGHGHTGVEVLLG